MVLGKKQAKSGGFSESCAVMECLEFLNIEDTLITTDAASSYPKVLCGIREKGGHYLMPVKGNQKVLLERMEEFFSKIPEDGQDPRIQDHCQTTEKNRDRYEQRACSVSSLENLYGAPGIRKKYSPDAQTVVRIIRTRVQRDHRRSVIENQADGSVMKRENPQRGQMREKSEVTYYITDMKADVAQRILRSIREHWGIENQLHWSLDVAFSEDDWRVKDKASARNLSALRKAAYNVIKKDKSKGSLRVNIQRAALSEGFWAWNVALLKRKDHESEAD